MCEHKWVHLDTRYLRIEFRYSSIFKRVDRFFCERCCEIKETEKRETCSSGIPEWFDRNNYELVNDY